MILNFCLVVANLIQRYGDSKIDNVGENNNNNTNNNIY